MHVLAQGQGVDQIVLGAGGDLHQAAESLEGAVAVLLQIHSELGYVIQHPLHVLECWHSVNPAEQPVSSLPSSIALQEWQKINDTYQMGGHCSMGAYNCSLTACSWVGMCWNPSISAR